MSEAEPLQPELYIGLMSGTSLDAVDAVVASIDDKQVVLDAELSQPIPKSLKDRLVAVNTGSATTLKEIGVIDHLLGELYASTVLKLLSESRIDASCIRAIGNHGQTVFHNPEGDTPFTVQLGDANVIAAETGIDTIADFRRLDVALGGQGAPLTPAFHHFLFHSDKKNTVVLNVGGICNITVLPVQGEVCGFDTGPGNMLMDMWCQQHTGQAFDKDANWARQGKVNEPLLRLLMSDPYLHRTPPKSTGREHYNMDWLDKQVHGDLVSVDVQRTLCEFTVRSAAEQIQACVPNQLSADESEGEHSIDGYGNDAENVLLVCGGGANNPLIMKRLQDQLPNWHVETTMERGVPVDRVEALAFAWLARQRTYGLPSNLPAVTGASREASLGVLYAAL